MHILFGGSVSSAKLHEDFAAQYLEYILPNYPNSKGYEEAIINSVKNGEEYGFFTLEKIIKPLYYVDSSLKGRDFRLDNVVAYIVLSLNRGSSVKIGPTIVKKEARKIGLGSLIKEIVHVGLKLNNKHLKDGRKNVLFGRNIRKVFSTSKEGSTSSQFYTRLGYKEEFSIPGMFRDDATERVFGMFIEEKKEELLVVRGKGKKSLTWSEEFSNKRQFSKFLIEEMSPYYYDIDESFANKVFEAQKYALFSEFEKKGKKVFFGVDSSGYLGGVVISVPKRGCNVKNVLVLSDNYLHKNNVRLGVEAVETFHRDKGKARGLYWIVPHVDQICLEGLLDEEYEMRGVIRRPYHDHVDCYFVNKFVY